MHRRLVNINRKWSNFLPMEYRSDNSKHYCKSNFVDNIFRDGNKLKRLLTDSIGDCFCWHFTKCYSDSITSYNMRGGLKYIDSYRCSQLPMEYWCNNRKHYSQPIFNDNILSHRNQLQRLLKDIISDSFCWLINYSYCDCITCYNLCGRIKYAHR